MQATLIIMRLIMTPHAAVPTSSRTDSPNQNGVKSLRPEKFHGQISSSHYARLAVIAETAWANTDWKKWKLFASKQKPELFHDFARFIFMSAPLLQELLVSKSTGSTGTRQAMGSDSNSDRQGEKKAVPVAKA